MVVDFNSIGQLNCNLQCKMCKPCTHNIIVQIVINNEKLHSIIICKHEMDLRLYTSTFKVGIYIIKTFNFFYWNTIWL
jgi:hypothetical protein